MKLINERGRSMIEMLGVLAIVGVLSVAGIAGYSKAMSKLHYEKQKEQINSIFQTILKIKTNKSVKELPTGRNTVTYLLDALKEVPDGMTYKDKYIYDRFGNAISIGNNNTTHGIYIRLSMAQKESKLLKTSMRANACIAAVSLAKEYADNVVDVAIDADENHIYLGGQSWVDEEGANNLGLESRYRGYVSEMTVDQIYGLCKNCTATKNECRLSIGFGY